MARARGRVARAVRPSRNDWPQGTSEAAHSAAAPLPLWDLGGAAAGAAPGPDGANGGDTVANAGGLARAVRAASSCRGGRHAGRARSSPTGSPSWASGVGVVLTGLWRATFHALLTLARYAATFGIPAAFVVALRLRRPAMLGFLVLPALDEWRRRQPDLDPGRWIALTPADDAAYGAASSGVASRRTASSQSSPGSK